MVTTSDGHIHAFGKQTSTDYLFGLPYGTEYIFSTWTDLTEQYGFPSNCRSLSITWGGQHVLVTTAGEIYVWSAVYLVGSGYYQTYGMYPVKNVQIDANPNYYGYSELSLLNTPVPGKVLGFYSANYYINLQMCTAAEDFHPVWGQQPRETRSRLEDRLSRH